MKHARPRGTDYRNAATALLIAFRMLFVNELAARRAFRAALEGRGRTRTLLALRSDPETFAPVLPDVDVRTVELVDEAAREFAACRAARPRALFREAANVLRRGYMLQCMREDRQRAEKEHATAAAELKVFENRREWVGNARKRLEEKTPSVYAEPTEAVVKRVIAYGLRHGAISPEKSPDPFYRKYSRDPGAFGRLWWCFRKPWCWLLGTTSVSDVEELKAFRNAGTSLIQMVEFAPNAKEFRAAQTRVEVAAAALAACGPTDEDQHDPYRASRQAAPYLLDAMRRLERDPSDAAPEVKRQLGRMLPSGAHFFISQAVQLACSQADEERRYGGDHGGRGHSRKHRL